MWAIHTPAGIIGLVAAAVALCAKKGGAFHRKAGAFFTISMLIMLISGFVAALLKESTEDMLLSAVVIYTVFTAWLAAHHKKIEIGFLEYIALGWIIAIVIAAFILGANWREVGISNTYPYWAIFAIFCAIGDIHNLRRTALSGTQRIIRHVWRIGFSLMWAMLSLTDKIVKMLGSNVKELPVEQLLYIIAVPTLFVLITTVFWIINILLFPRNNFSNYGD